MSSILEAFALTPEQHAAALERARDVTVAAGAGSGKTRTLVARYVALLAEGHPPRSLAAVTFTEKAARVMRNRVRAAVQDWRSGACPPAERADWEAIEADIDTARIGTLHSLCAAILRAHPAEAGIDPLFEVLDEGAAAVLRARAVSGALAWGLPQPELRTLFQAFTAGDLEGALAGLLGAAVEPSPDGVWELWKAQLTQVLRAFSEASPAAGAVAELRVLQADHQLLADAGDKLTPKVEGFLTIWLSFEQALAQDEPFIAAPLLFDARRACAVGNLGKTGRAKAALKEARTAYDAEIDPWLGGAAAADPRPDPAFDRQLLSLLDPLSRLLAEARRAYRAAQDERRALDFDDLEAGAARLLQRPEVRARWQGQVAAVLVDEFQDTNARQREIVEALSGAAPGRLFVVGDAKQSIYRFRGAQVEVFRQLTEAIQARGGLSLELNTTYRAHAPLVALLNELLGPMFSDATPKRAAFAVPFSPLASARPTPPRSGTAPYVEFILGRADDAETARRAAASGLAQRLRAWHSAGVFDWGDSALLFRASTGFPYYEAALQAAGIPFVTVAGRGFYDRPEVRDVLNLLRALAYPWDDLALAGLLRSPAFGLSDAALYQLRWPSPERARPYQTALEGDLSHLSSADQRQALWARDRLRELAPLADRTPVAEFLQRVLDATHYFAILASEPAGPRLHRNLNKLLADAQASGAQRVSEFLEYLETLQTVGAREGEAAADAGGAVRLMTVHKAKGLEFPLVVLADAAREARGAEPAVSVAPDFGVIAGPGRWPQRPIITRLARAQMQAQAAAETARLLYVALTRAQDKLVISGHLTPKSPAGWLKDLLAVTGLDPAAAASEQAWTLPASGQTVRVSWVDQVEAANAPTPAASAPPPALNARPLYGSLIAEPRLPDHDQPEPSEGALVGVLVHAALARWRFPGEPGFERFLETLAKDQGEVAPARLAGDLRRATALLRRLHADPRWADLEDARRRGQAYSEVPFSIGMGGALTDGRIDLIYRPLAGPWQVVDFKTDTVTAAEPAAAEPAAGSSLEARYRRQVEQYQAAAGQFLGQAVAGTLCWLDWAGHVRWQDL